MNQQWATIIIAIINTTPALILAILEIIKYHDSKKK
ncbi:hypothetical protein FHX51_000770 [Aeriscardovia aeriphila]|uniref:Uncharacterized protein n=1 Tax=Aeriscardovia aeriphila TaxID=218139 RepID=A0A261FA48_9BIFI|nr:hypothetical protein [Aeriscardovia aeriphila]OZG56029.1 hypothetical protein AEAE_0517 [Aeriscardovia aeriphila]